MKNKSILKEMYGNISLYPQYFSPVAGNNVRKIYFYFLILTKKYFILFYYIKKAQYKIRNIYM